jgi:dipeptidyl aminopeptidase/acylaminoacyl peptidase
MRSLIIAIFMAWGLCASAIAQNQLTVEDFARDAHLGFATLSPDGSKLAYTSPTQNGRALVVKNLDTGELTGAMIEDFRTSGLRWAGEDILLLTASQARGVSGIVGDVDIAITIAFYLQEGMEARNLLDRARHSTQAFDSSAIVGIEPDTGRILVPVMDEQHNWDLLSVIPETRMVSVVAHGAELTRDWVVGGTTDGIVRLDYSNRDNNQMLRLKNADGWQTVHEIEPADRPAYTLHGFLADGRLAVSDTLLVPGNNRRDRLYALSLETGETEDIVFENDQFDVSHTIIDPHNNLVVGVAWYDNFREVEWFDVELAERQGELELVLAGQSPRIQSWSTDRQRLLVVTEAGNEPAQYYIYDVLENTLEGIGPARDALSGGVLANRFPTRYPARDGTQIPAYLTLPAGPGPHPTIILPHGGPEARDTGGFDRFAHFFASRGYAVLQPNFRGSSGYGHDWVLAGHGQWGRGIMQHDLSDGVAQLVAAGIADPDRVCIVGASYGGYAALAGAAFTPDTYTCAAAIAPVSELQETVEYARDRYGFRHWIMPVMYERFNGDASDEREGPLRELSPLRFADEVTIPILLIQGREDTVVPVEHTRSMHQALRRADVDVEYIEMREGDHWLSTEAMRTTALSALENFLDEHIGTDGD